MTQWRLKRSDSVVTTVLLSGLVATDDNLLKKLIFYTLLFTSGVSSMELRELEHPRSSALAQQ